jgi:hypothetical protein
MFFWSEKSQNRGVLYFYPPAFLPTFLREKKWFIARCEKHTKTQKNAKFVDLRKFSPKTVTNEDLE